MPSASALYLQEGFDPELGFLRRPAIFQANAASPVVFRTPTSGIRNITLGAEGRLETSDTLDELLRLSGGWTASLQTDEGYTVSARGDYVQDVVREEFELVDELTIAPGEYRGAWVQLGFATPEMRNPVVGITATATNGFFGGSAYRGNLSFSASFGPHFRTSVEAVGALLDFRGRDLIGTLALNSVFSLTPSPWVVLDLVGQVNTVADRFIGMARLRWRYLPGSDLFLVYRENLDYESLQSERRVTLKIGYRYDAVL